MLHNFSVFALYQSLLYISVYQIISNFHCSNNIRDLETDKKSGIVTMAILLGQSKAPLLYTVLLFVPYVITSIMVWYQSFWLLLPLLSIPLAMNLNSQCWHGNIIGRHDDREHNHSNGNGHGNLTELPEKTAMLNLVFSVLYIVSLLVM